MSNFKRLINEGETVKITNFGVDANNPPKWQKARVDSPIKLLFNYITKAVICKPDASIPSSGLELVEFDYIPSFDANFFIGLYNHIIFILFIQINIYVNKCIIKCIFIADVIGRLTKVGNIIHVEKANARKLDIEIEDEK